MSTPEKLGDGRYHRPMIDIPTLRRLVEAATPGPWTASDDERGDVVIWGPQEDWLANVGNWSRQHPQIDAQAAARQYVEMRDAADAAFIAAAREAVPALLDELERLRELPDE